VTIETDYSASVKRHAGLQLQMDFKNVSVELLEYLVNCDVRADEQVNGCRSCQTGAVVKVYCGAIVPITILIQCSGANASYVLPCDNATHRLIIHSDDRIYNEECHFQCSRTSGSFRLHGNLETVTVKNSIDPVSSDWWSKPAQVEAPFKNILNALIDLFTGILKFVLNNPIAIILLVIAALIVKIYLLPKSLTFSSIKRSIPTRKRPFSVPRRKSHVL
jgi:hypothetical protein